MKSLILANHCQWLSWNKKTQFIKDWFKPVIDLEFTMRSSDFNNIPTEQIIDTEGHNYTAIKQMWINDNIALQAQKEGFQTVILSQPFNEFVSFPAMGYSFKSPCGVYIIVVGSDENDVYNFQGLRYPIFRDRWTEAVRHELCHNLYNTTKKEDRTHYYYSTGELDKILMELETLKTSNTPTNTGYKYFKDNEIVGLKPGLVQMLDKARGIAKTPFKITSGYRSVEKNRAVGGVPNSSHTKGLAVDLACTDNTKRTAILLGLLTCGIPTFIEICKSHIHVDMDKSIHAMGQTMWANDD